MTKTRPFAELADEVKADPVRRARIETEKRAIRDGLALSELRARRDSTQQSVARSLGVTQANISRIEHEEDLYLSTLRDYVAALGGCLEVNAVFPDGTVTLVPAKHHVVTDAAEDRAQSDADRGVTPGRAPARAPH